MKKEIDKKKVASLIEQLLIEFGDDPKREGLIDTPMRVADMYAEVLQGMRYTNDEIARENDKTFECVNNNDLVVIKDIECFSYCEHHLALMYNMKVSVGYIPNGRVIGLSKVARVVQMCAARLQLQERLGADIAYVMKKITKSNNVMLVIEARHSCMSARGVKNTSSITKTSTIRGSFQSNYELRQEFYSLIQ